MQIERFEKFSPKRIILDKNLEINLKSYIFRSVKKKNTILFYNFLDKKKFKILNKKGIILIKSKLNKDKLFDLKVIIKKLFDLGTRNLLVEGGDKITQNLIKNKLIDKFYLFQSSKKFLKSKLSKKFTSHDILNRKYKKISKISSKLAKDNISIYKR